MSEMPPFRLMMGGVDANVTSLRQRAIRWMNPLQRIIEAEVGSPLLGEWIQIKDFKNMIDRFGVAKRANNIHADARWEVQPDVYETDDNTETPFEKRLKQVGASLVDEEQLFEDEATNPLWGKCLEADRAMGIGRFGVMLIGIDDGKPLDQPVDGFDSNTKPERNVLFIRIFDETQVTVSQIDNNPGTRNYKKPLLYNIDLDELETQGQHDDVRHSTAVRGDIHWHRIVHLSEGDLAHNPRLWSVWDHILGLRKLYLGSPEMYWKGAFQGLVVEGEPGMSVEDPAAFKKDMEEFQEGLKRALLVEGAKAKGIAPNVEDPTPFIKAELQGLCIDLDCPERIFVGSERGELASTTDLIQWGEVIAGSRTTIGKPKIIVPVISRLIKLGVLPRPSKYFIEWEGTEKLSAIDKADIALKRTQAAAAYVKGDVEQLIGPEDWLQDEYGYTMARAQAVLKNREGLLVEEGGTDADPTAPQNRPAPVIVPGGAGDDVSRRARPAI